MKKLLHLTYQSTLVFCLTTSAAPAMDDYPWDGYNFCSTYREFVPDISTPSKNSSPSSTHSMSYDQSSLELTQDERESFYQSLKEPIEEGSPSEIVKNFIGLDKKTRNTYVSVVQFTVIE